MSKMVRLGVNVCDLLRRVVPVLIKDWWRGQNGVLWDMLEGTDRGLDCEYNVMYCVVLEIIILILELKGQHVVV